MPPHLHRPGVSPMTHLDRLDEWLTAHRDELERLGTLTYARRQVGLPNPSADLVVSLDDAEVELLLWESGEAEFNYGTYDDPAYEHVEVESPEELQALLERVLDAVTKGAS